MQATRVAPADLSIASGLSSKAIAIALLAFAITHGVYQFGRAFLHYKQGLDFTPEYIAARMLVDHRDLRFYDYEVVKKYGRDLGLHGPLGPDDPVIDYSYAPWLSILYAPISRLSWDAARHLWFFIGTVAALGAAALAGATMAPEAALRPLYAAGSVAAACFYFPIAYGLMAGQANDLTLLGVVASFFLLKSNRPLMAGLVLAPAALWKIVPGVAVLFLILRREWRALAGVALGCALLVFLSLPFVGVSAWESWLAHLLDHKASSNAALRNHSIASSVLRLFQSNESAWPLLDAPGLVPPLTLAIQALAVGLVLVSLFPACRRRDPEYAVQYGATLVLAVLLAPLSWEHYGIFLLPAFIACAAASSRRLTSSWPGLSILGAAFAVWAFLFQVRDEYQALATGWKVVLIPAKTYAALALLCVSAWLCVSKDKKAPRGEPITLES